VVEMPGQNQYKVWWVVFVMNGCLTNQQYADVGGPLGSGGRLGSAGRRVDVPLSSEDGSLDGSEQVVVGTGHGAAG